MNKLTNDQAYWLDQLWYGIHDREGDVPELDDVSYWDLFVIAQRVLLDGEYDSYQKEMFNIVRRLVLNKKIVLELNGYEASETSWLEPYCKKD